jgi:acyl carrier protein
MKREDIIKDVTDIFKDTLDNDSITLSDTTTAGEIEEWDSLTHIQLVVGIEKKFKIRFTSKEIQSWGNVGQMIDSIASKVA